MPVYRHNGDVYDIPQDKAREFESQFPEATVEVYSGNDVYDIPVGVQDEFFSRYSDAKYSPTQGVDTDSDGSVRITEPKEEESRFGILGKMGQYMGSPSAYVPMPQAEEREELTQVEIGQRAAMRQMLQESGTIDRMEEMEKEARKNKFKAFGEALAYTPQVSSFGVASNIYKDTEEQLADAQRALEASEEHRQNKAMEQTLDVALDKARAGEWGGIGGNNVGNGVVDFGLGLWDSATRMSTWDFGVSDTLNGLTIAQVVKKWEEDPESLTATERNLLDTMGMATAVQEAYQDQVGIGYAVGESLPQSAGFMASMYLNPASGLGKSLARQAVKKYGRQSIAKNLARIGGDIAETAIMTATTGGGRVVADALDRINGQSTYEIDPETGLVMYGGQEDQKTVGEAVVKAIGSNFIDNYSEALGEYFDPLLGMSRRLAAGGLRKMNLDKWADALSDVQPSQMAASIRSLREKAKFGGVFGEIMEEEVGMALNAITVGDYTFSKEEADASNGKKQWIFDLENQLTTALSCAIMSGAMTGVETIGNVRYRREMERSVADAEKAARAAVGDEMIAQIDQSSPEGMVDILRDAYMDQNLSLQQKRTLADYATQRVRMQYYNAADAKARRQINVTQQNTIDAYEAGRHAQLPQYYNIDQEYRKSEAAINERENAEEIWDAIRLMNNMDENERQNIMRDFSEEDQELIRNWRYNAYRRKGAVNHRAEQVEDLVDEYAGQVNPYVVEDKQGNRNVTTAVYGDNVVYVMAQNADGATTIVTNDGSKKMVNANELEHVQTHNADELIERFRQQTTEVVNQETEKNLSYPSEVLEPAEGVTVETLDGKQWQVAATDGENVEIVGLVFDKKSGQWIPNSGDYRKMTREQFMDWQKAELDRKKANTYEQGDELIFYVKGEPISAEITGITPDGDYNVQISHLADGLDKSVSDVYTAEELRKLTTPSSKVSEKTTENESTPSEEIKQSVSEEVVNSQIGEDVNAPTAEVAESVNTALSRVPKDAEGNPLYEQTDADTAWDAIVEETEGDAEMAQRIAEEMVADKKAALTKMRKGKPKKGATVAEKIANEKAHIAAIAQAEQEVAAWEKIAQREARRREAAMSEAERYAAEMEQKNISEGLRALGEPQSLREYVLAQLAGGAYKLRWNDKENGTKGFGSHTGLSTEEMKARLSMVDNKNGLTPEEIAHSIVENMDASFGEVDVMDITDMVIDAVSTHASRRAMLNGMVESRAELLRQQEIAEQEAKDAWYMEQYHATEEELAAYNEYLAGFAEEIYGEDSDYEQRIITFAEQQLGYDNQGTDAGLRSSADQGEGLASDREGGRSMGETEQLDRREVFADAAGVAEAEDGRAGSSVSAQSDDRQARIDRAVREYWDNLDNSPEAVAAAERDWQRYQEDLAGDASETVETLENGDVRRTNLNSNGEIDTVVLERDGNVISVDTYEDGALFERTDYDANGNATKVTRYKDGEVVSEQEYKDGKRKVTANVFEMAEEAQKKRKPKKKQSKQSIHVAYDRLKDAYASNKMRGIAEKRVLDILSGINNVDELANIYLQFRDEDSKAATFISVKAEERILDVSKGLRELKESIVDVAVAIRLGKDNLDTKYKIDDIRKDVTSLSYSEILPLYDVILRARDRYNPNNPTEVEGSKKAYESLRFIEEELKRKKSNDKLAEKNHQEERKEGAATTEAGKSRPSGTFSVSYYTQFLKELFQNAHWEERPSEEVAGIIRRHNAGKTLLAHTEDEREFLSALRALTNNEIQGELSNINNALQSDEYTDEEKEELKRAKNLITRFVNRGERNAVIEDLTGAKLGEKLPLSKIDELFEMYNSDANVAELYARVRAIAEQIGLDFWFEEMEDRQLGGYLHSDNRVRLNAHMLYSSRMQRQGVASTIVHEMLHAVVGYAVKTQQDVKMGLTPAVKLSKQVLNAANTIAKIYEKAVKGNPALVHQEYDIEKEEWVEVADYGTTSVEEMLVEISNPEFRDKLKQIEYNGRSVWQRIWDAIKSMFTQPSDVTNPTAYDSMAKALDVLINEFSVDAYRKFSGLEESASRVYHGSGALFDKFDHSFMGTGEGNQAFGWGTYVSEAEGVGKTYAKIASKPMLTYKGQEMNVDGYENPWRVIKDLYDMTRGKISQMRADAEKYDRLAEDDSPFKPVWGEIIGILKNARRGDIKVTPRRVLYSVEIPDDNVSNYLKWYENVPKEALTKAKAKLYGVLVEGDYKGAERELKRELDDLFALEQTGQNLYGNISAYLGSDKEASQFLHEMGYVGLKYPTNTLHGGNIDGTNNYVIFNENDLEIVDNIRFRDGAPFFSNAERAVENIKQQKATPEQWLAMIKKDGGLKAGEDKWMGLSDWLTEKKEAGVKSLTKDEVLEFIRTNEIHIEEVEYGDNPQSFEELKDEYEELLREEGYDAAHDAMIDRFGDDFDVAFEDLGGELSIANEEAAATLLGSGNIINHTRLDHTTEGLENKKEIAFVVPTIESWNQSDNIHFGDAGEGRAVAWVRFGETTDEDGNRVLVIDEVQSKRHDEGRAKGYRNPRLTKLSRRIGELSDMMHTEGLSEELYNELQSLKEEREKLVISINPRLAAVDNELDEKKARLEELRKRKETEDSDILREEIDELRREVSLLDQRWSDEINNAYRAQVVAVHDAPFDKNYHELVMKRMLRFAAENGFDKVAWNTGKQVAKRFGISQAVSSIEYSPLSNGHYKVIAYGALGYPLENVPTVYNSEQEIADTFGRGIASKIVNDIEENKKAEEKYNAELKELKERRKGIDEESEEYEQILEEAGRLLSLRDATREAKSIEGEGLSIGGEDRNALYDEMIPRFMNKYTKKWGAKVGEVTLPNVEEAGRTMWSVDVTPEMRESVMQGQPMFREGMGAISDREVSYENDPIAKFQGKPRYYGKRASAFAERERRRMENAAKEAAEMLGIEAEIITDASTLKGRKAKAKGWYDISNKKVVVVVPNHVSIGDAVRTVLHEGVAHHGLRELFGDGFDAMLDNIYNNVAPELKARIDAIAERTGVSTSVATEEYLASLAETTNFEEAMNRGWWSKIKQFFVDMLNKLGMPGLNLKEEITDNELRYLLWRSYQNLVDPNAYLKPLGYLDDVAKQKELKVGNYAENTMATQRAAEMNEAEEWSAITIQRIEELEAQAAQLENEIADMEADRDADDESRYDMWEEQLDVLRKQSQEIYDELEGLYSLEAEDEYIADYEAEREAEKQRLLYQKRIDNAYLKAVREGNWEEATNLFRQYVLSKAEDDGIVPMDYGVGYRGGAHSSIAKKVKEENPDAIAEAAYQMSIRIPKGSILVPMPSRNGDATYTVKLAEAIAKATDSEVRDVLKGKARMSVYEAKQKGIKMTPEDLGMYTTEELPRGKNIVIIDNVIDKGTTALAAVSAVKGASVVAYAYTLGDKQRAATLKLAEPVTYDDNKRIIPLSQRFNKETDDIRYRLVDNQAEIDRLESEPTIKAYRAMQVINGELYPPMSAVVDGKLREPIALGQWEQSEERPDLADDNGRFKLDKGNKKSLKAAYNPYFHSSSTPLNDQFSEAQDRDNLVTVEVEVPVSEADGTSGYKAEKAKDAVGTHQWKAGIIQGQLTGTREVFLTRWDKPIRIVPESEVADVIVEMFDGKDIVMPSNVVTPQLRKELEARGITFVETDNQGKLVEGEHKGEHYSKVYGKKSTNKSKKNAEITAEIEREAAALGVPVRIVRSVDELPDEDTRKRAVDGQLKGYFDPRTGEVVVYEPNTDNANDAKRTVLHEIVGHKGLRQLIGEERYDKAMVQLMYMLPSEVRDAVLRRAERHGWNAAVAMDEYLAEQAERDVQPTWWGKVNAKIRALLRNMGFNVMLTDADVTYLLWRSRKKLMGDTAFDMATNAILKQAARKSAEADAWNEQAFKDAEMRDFEKGAMQRLRNRIGDAQNEYDSAMKSMAFKQRESWQDSMRSLKVFMDTLEKESGKKISDFENAYMYENAMSSANLMEMQMFRHDVYGRLLKAIHELMESGAKYEEVVDYMMAKHGLERNEKMARKEAEEKVEKWRAKAVEEVQQKAVEMQKEQDQRNAIIEAKAKSAYNVKKQRLKGQLERGTITQAQYDHYMQMAEQTYQNEIAAMNTTPPIDVIAEIEKIEGKAEKKFNEYLADHRDYSGLTALTGKEGVAGAESAAMQMVSDFEAKHNTDFLWNETRACTQTILNISHDAGILSDEVYDELWSQYEYYIPLRGFDETTAEEVYTYVGDNKSPYNAPIKTAKGRKSKADDPIATIATMAESAIVEANRNRLKQRFLYMVERHRTELASVSSVWVEKDPITGDCVARFANIPNDATPEEAAQAQKAFEERMEQLHEQEPERYYKAGEKPNIPYRVEKKANEHEHQIIVKRNGKDVVITINGDPRVAQAINGLTNAEAVEGFSKFAGKVNRFLSANFTTRNPAFVVSNFVRDGFYTNSMVWAKEGPAYAWKYNQNWAKATKLLPSLVRKYKRYEKGDKSALDMSDPVERAFYEFMINGGETGYTVINSVEDYKGIVAGDLKTMQGGVVGNTKKAVQAVGEVLDTFGRWAEDTSRFAAFLTSREMGRSVTKSIWDAKEISVNFNKKGSGRKMTQHDKGLNSILGWMSQQGRNLYVFWNAGMQGLYNFSKAVKEHPGKMAGLAGVYFGLGMAMAAIFGGHDDDEDYWNLPEYVRRNNICFRVGNKFVALPLPIELRAIYGMGELAMSWMAGKEDPKKVGMKVVQQMSQVLPIDMMAEGGGFKAFIPSWAKPIVEVGVNTDWTGMPIYRKRTPFNEYDPTWMLAFKSTSPELVAASRAINEATNKNLPSGKENKYDRGWADIEYLNNPAAWEHIAEGYLGGLATMFNQTKKSAMAIWNEDLREVRNVPVVSRFVKDVGEKSEEYALREDYFNAKEVVDELRSQRGHFRKESIDPSLTEEQRKDVMESRIEMEKMVNATISQWNNLENARKRLEDMVKDNPDQEVTFDGKKGNAKDALDEVTRRMVKLTEGYQ